MDELDEYSPDPNEQNEWLNHKFEAEVFERVISEVVADLSARSDPPRRRAPVRELHK